MPADKFLIIRINSAGIKAIGHEWILPKIQYYKYIPIGINTIHKFLLHHELCPHLPLFPDEYSHSAPEYTAVAVQIICFDQQAYLVIFLSSW